MDHFYDVVPVRTPGQVIGLDDNSEPKYACGYLPHQLTNSFVWASWDNIPGPEAKGTQVGTNQYNWQRARAFEYAALTSTNQSARNTNMAMLLYSLGHVLHLNQDTTSPDHVRDDNHYSIHYFEDYGMNNCTNNPQWFAPPTNHGWAYWQAQGFTNLLNFWDRNKYKEGDASTLDQEAGRIPGVQLKLGLAEFCNGNFLGENALYRECADITNHVFPFPSLDSTDYSHSRINDLLVSGVRIVYLNDGKLPNQGDLVQRIYLDKERDGITFFNHCALGYLGVAKALRSPRATLPASPAIQRVSISINDANVLQAYHNILIPKAVEYSAGILDYFFRGTIAAGIVGVDTNVPEFTVLFANTSSQDFYNGTFYIFQDSNTVRTLVALTNLASLLPDSVLAANSSVTATFTGLAPTNKLVIFYQGTIGVSNGVPLDPVDAGIAIAINTPFPLTQVTTTNYWVSLDSLHLQGGATITGTLYSDEFPFTLTPGNYQVTVNYAHFDDTGTIGSLTCTEGSSCTFTSDIVNAEVPSGDISISADGRHLEVPITATDDPHCENHIGWGQPYSTQPVSVTWKAWPGQ